MTDDCKLTEPQLDSIDGESPGKLSFGFRAWVARATVTGGRVGGDQQIFIIGLAIMRGQMVYHPQGVVVYEGRNAQGTALVFRDKTGAMVAKRF